MDLSQFLTKEFTLMKAFKLSILNLGFLGCAKRVDSLTLTNANFTSRQQLLCRTWMEKMWYSDE